MKRLISNIFFVVFITFVFIVNVNADCSFEERKELLNKAKSVDAFFEPDLDNNNFTFYLFNLDDDLFVELKNLNTGETIEIHKYQFDEDYYTMKETNVDNLLNYKLIIYSGNSSCYYHELASKNIKKGIINKFHKNDICKGIEDYKYCLPFFDKKINLTNDEIYIKITEYKNSLYKEEEIIDEKFGWDDFINILKNYWYIPTVIISLLTIFFVIRYINKKRGEL